MEDFATERLTGNRRRDQQTLCVFHFADSDQLINVREAIRGRHPNAFFIPRSLQAQHPGQQLEPIGMAYYIFKTGERKTDLMKGLTFFHVI